MVKQKITVEQLKEEIENGLNPTQIAIKYDMVYSTIYGRLKDAGLKSRFETFEVKIINGKVKCIKCNLLKTLNNFKLNKTTGYIIAICNICETNIQNIRKNKSLEKNMLFRLYNIKGRSKNKNIPFNLTLEDLLLQYNKQNGKCFYTDIDMNIYYGKGHNRKDGITIDKIIPEKGYIKGNIVFCSFRANSAKLDFTLDEMKLWMPEWYKRVREFLKDTEDWH